MEKQKSLLRIGKRSGGLVLLAVMVFTLLLAGCGESTSTPKPASNNQTPSAHSTPRSTPTANTSITVSIKEKMGKAGDEYSFDPAGITILPGTMVVWQNMTDEDHVLTSGTNGVFTATSKVAKNGSYKMLFTKVGTLSYSSKDHPTATGSVTVQTNPEVMVQLTEKRDATGDIYSLNPGGIVLKVGSAVNWENMSDEEQVLTSDTKGVFTAASVLKKNGSYKLTFAKIGTYHYFSKTHPTTKGMIVVVR